jgi:hypothetical protein
MKKSILLAMLAFSMAFVACKKEEDEPKPKTVQEKITGKWKGEEMEVILSFPAPIGTQTDVEDISYLNIEFKSDGTVVSDSLGLNPETVNWSLKNDQTIIVDGQELMIKTITDTQFHFGLDTVIDFSGIPVPVSQTIKFKK